jgi:hypothetical protein
LAYLNGGQLGSLNHSPDQDVGEPKPSLGSNRVGPVDCSKNLVDWGSGLETSRVQPNSSCSYKVASSNGGEGRLKKPHDSAFNHLVKNGTPVFYLPF